MNIIEELYYGNISPWEKQFNKSSEFAKQCDILVECEKELKDFFALYEYKKEKEILDKLIIAEMETSDFCEKEKFIEGFKLGAKLVLEIFVFSEKSVLRDIS